MARRDDAGLGTGLDGPLGLRTPWWQRLAPDGEWFGRVTERLARAMGTPGFLFGMTVFIVIWMLWNTLAPATWRFDSASLGFTALTLALSLQASYAAPLLLLAQNRQDDRDRVQIEQDRQRAERNLADTEYLAREVVNLRMTVKELVDRAERDREREERLHETIDRLAARLEQSGRPGSAPAPRDAPVHPADSPDTPASR